METKLELPANCPRIGNDEATSEGFAILSMLSLDTAPQVARILGWPWNLETLAKMGTALTNIALPLAAVIPVGPIMHKMATDLKNMGFIEEMPATPFNDVELKKIGKILKETAEGIMNATGALLDPAIDVMIAQHESEHAIKH